MAQTAPSSGQISIFSDATHIYGTNNLFWDNTNNRLGINNSTPAYSLDITGTANIYNTSDTILRLSRQSATSTLFKLGTDSALIINNNNSDVLSIKDGNVGIGTTGPGARLEVNGQVKITGGGPAAGSVLTSDAAGLASWQAASGGIPAGMVSFFNLAACPTGWTALAAAQGRYLVGLTTGGTLAGTAGNALSDSESRAAGVHSHSVSDPGHYHNLTTTSASEDSWVSAGTDKNVRVFGLVSTYSASSGVGVVASNGIAGTNAPYLQLLVSSKN